MSCTAVSPSDAQVPPARARSPRRARVAARAGSSRSRARRRVSTKHAGRLAGSASRRILPPGGSGVSRRRRPRARSAPRSPRAACPSTRSRTTGWSGRGRGREVVRRERGRLPVVLVPAAPEDPLPSGRAASPRARIRGATSAGARRPDEVDARARARARDVAVRVREPRHDARRRGPRRVSSARTTRRPRAPLRRTRSARPARRAPRSWRVRSATRSGSCRR